MLQRITLGLVRHLVVLTTVSVFFCANSVAQTATWTKVCQLNTSGYVTSAYFFNSTSGLIGYYGTGYSSPILRTTDGGLTWLPTVSPTASGTPWITDIWFMNDRVGWATMIYAATTPSYLWKTTDGGLTWSPTGFPTKNPSGVRATNRALCVTQYQGAGISVSTDQGATFSAFFGNNKDHLGFVDSLHGAATGFRDEFYYTSDGGLTWQQSPTSIKNECWGIYGMPGSTVFVAAHEAPGGGMASIFRSLDYGMDWVQIVNAPNALTGGIGGNGKFLYIQTLSKGFYISVDSGMTWTPINGPSNQLDSRFAVIDCAIYAFDHVGGVYVATNVTGIHSICGIKQVDLVASPCSVARNIEYLDNTMVDSIDIIDLSLIDSSVPPAIAGSLSIDSLPKLVNTIPPGRSMGYILRWAPSSLRDTGLYGANLRLIYRDHNTQTLDTTTITVSLTGQAAKVQISTPKRFATPRLPSCKGIDTTLLFQNRSCDTLTIKSAWLTKDKEWLISDTSGRSLTFPILLPPRFRPTNTSSIFTIHG